MKIFSTGIKDGYIEDKFGKFASEEYKLNGVPILSLPLSWSDLPPETKCLALVMQDYDAVPVCGFSWLHWLVSDIDPDLAGLPENSSREDVKLIQGKTSLASKQICGDMPEEVTNFYSGPRPPDKDHEYEITVYALDATLNLKPGFRLNELIKAMRGHVLGSATLLGNYRAK